ALVAALSATLRGRHVLERRAARGRGFSVAGALLVDGACRDLLSGVGALAAIDEALLDVLVLPFALLAPGLLRHDSLPSDSRRWIYWTLGGYPGSSVRIRPCGEREGSG